MKSPPTLPAGSVQQARGKAVGFPFVAGGFAVCILDGPGLGVRAWRGALTPQGNVDRGIAISLPC
jgi:hypothetical protein